MRLNPKEVAQAREWLADCTWADVEPEEFGDIPAWQIERGVNRHYDGGLDAFIATCQEARSAALCDAAD